MSMPMAPSAHQCFVDMTRAFYRQAECELPYFESDPDAPIAFEACVGDVKLTVGYDPLAGTASAYVYCVLGALPPHDTAQLLRQLLELNLAQARQHEGTYCVDGNTQELVYYLRLAPAQTDAVRLSEALIRIARLAVAWREGRLCIPAASEDPMADQGPAPWAVFG